MTHDVVVGADGAYSALREVMVRSERADYRQEHLPWGYKELTIAPAGGGFALDPEALHIWPWGDSMMIALPNPDHTFTATLFWPYEGPPGLRGPRHGGRVTARSSVTTPTPLGLFENLADEFAGNPVGNLMTVRVWPWTRGRLALLGDAAHAIVPFFGQGMNCAFEDAVELDRCLAETNDDWHAALGRYAERRKPNADAIAELALENFVEMRDKVASPWFRLGKRIEHAVERSRRPHPVAVRAGQLHHRARRGGPRARRGTAAVPVEPRRPRRRRRRGGGGHRPEVGVVTTDRTGSEGRYAAPRTPTSTCATTSPTPSTSASTPCSRPSTHAPTPTTRCSSSCSTRPRSCG